MGGGGEETWEGWGGDMGRNGEEIWEGWGGDMGGDGEETWEGWGGDKGRNGEETWEGVGRRYGWRWGGDMCGDGEETWVEMGEGGEKTYSCHSTMRQLFLTVHVGYNTQVAPLRVPSHTGQLCVRLDWGGVYIKSQDKGRGRSPFTVSL